MTVHEWFKDTMRQTKGMRPLKRLQKIVKLIIYEDDHGNRSKTN